jgi:purine-cytosine permease-like protein
MNSGDWFSPILIIVLICTGILGFSSTGLIIFAEAKTRPRLSFEMLSLSWFSRPTRQQK